MPIPRPSRTEHANATRYTPERTNRGRHVRLGGRCRIDLGTRLSHAALPASLPSAVLPKEAAGGPATAGALATGELATDAGEEP